MLNWQDRLNPQAGGAEAHLHEVFGRIARRGHRVTLLVSGWPGAEARVELDGMDVHRVGGRYTFSIAAPRYYRNRLGDLRFDVTVEDLNKIPLFTPVWGREPLALIVHHLFGATAFREAAPPLALATMAAERPLGAVYRNVPAMAVSESTKADLVRRGLDPGAIQVIPNGVDLTWFAPSKEVSRFEEPTLLYLGRLKKYKRVDLVMRAVARLLHRGMAVRLLVAGTGDRARALERLRSKLGLESAVRLLGHVTEEEKRDLFRRAWVHVLTSPKEGWGITNMEAAACGTPTVASDAPGLRDSVVDGVTGRLVPHGDVGALADALQELLADRERREQLGRQAREFAAAFTWDRSADATLSFLDTVARAGAEA